MLFRSIQPSPDTVLRNSEPVEISVTVGYELYSLHDAGLGIYVAQIANREDCNNPEAPKRTSHKKVFMTGPVARLDIDGEGRGQKSVTLTWTPRTPPEPGFVHVWATIWYPKDGDLPHVQASGTIPCYALTP